MRMRIVTELFFRSKSKNSRFAKVLLNLWPIFKSPGARLFLRLWSSKKAKKVRCFIKQKKNTMMHYFTLQKSSFSKNHSVWKSPKKSQYFTVYSLRQHWLECQWFHWKHCIYTYLQLWTQRYSRIFVIYIVTSMGHFG